MDWSISIRERRRQVLWDGLASEMIDGSMMNASKLSSHCLMMTIFLVPRAVGAADDSVSHSLDWAILFLMAMPYTIGGSILAWIVYYRWRGNRRRERRRRRASFLPRTTCREPLGRTTERHVRERGQVPQSHGLNPVVRGLRLIETPKESGR